MPIGINRYATRMLVLIASLLSLHSTIQAQPVGSNPSIEQLTTVLNSIDTYRPQTQVSGKIEIFGSTSMDSLAHGWTSGFKQFHPKVDIVISAAGSEAALDRLLQTPNGIAMLSRPVTSEELVGLRAKGLKKPAAFVVAREALGVFVNANNPVESISGEQLRAVFTKGIPEDSLTWQLLGADGAWAKKPIHVVSRSERSGTQKYLRNFVFDSAELREGVSSHISNAEVLQAVKRDPLAIAVCGLRSTGESVKSLHLTAGSNVIPSDDHAILAGNYPLMRPMTVVIDLGQEGERATASRELVRYALCQAGQTQAILAQLFPVELPLLQAGLVQLSGEELR